jgi:hypothetical protein
VAAEEEAVAGGARRQAVADQTLFGFEAEHQGLCARADDHRMRPVLGVVHPDLERALAEIDAGDLLGDDLGPEPQGLLAHAVHQLGPHDALRKTGEVLDLGGEHQLSAGLVARAGRFTLDEQRGQVGPGGVDGGGEAGRARTDDDDVSYFWANVGHGESLLDQRRRTRAARRGTFSWRWRCAS